MDSEIMTIKEIAEYLKITENAAFRLASEGKVSDGSAKVKSKRRSNGNWQYATGARGNATHLRQY